MSAHVRWTRWLAVAAVAACGACQTYRPLALENVRRGDRVRVVLARPVPVQLRQITVDQPSLIDAEAVGVENGNLVLSALWVERLGGVGSPGEGLTVSIPVDAVGQLSRRRFAWARTGLLLGAAVVGTSLGWRVFGVGVSGSGTGQTGGEQL
jgi:hypothetical protein